MPTLKPAVKPAPAFRYETLAQYIIGLVDAGTLKPGDKAPSLRHISQSRGVSVTTALQAYRMLESKGVLEAQPQSGFIVRQQEQATSKIPPPSRGQHKPRHVAITSRISKMLELASDTSLVPLGCAIPSTEFLASSQLDRFLSRAARTEGEKSNVYSSPRGELPLREAISHRSVRNGQSFGANDITITQGCTEALQIALRAVCKAGDTVAIESPTYFAVLQILKSLSLKALELPTHPTDGIDVQALKDALKSGQVKTLLLASSFSNPLGYVMSEDKKREILALTKKHKIPLIEDDIHGDIYFTEHRPRPFSAIDPEADVIYCNSFSKTLAPGYRLGWVATSKRSERMVEEKFALTLASPVLLQKAMADYLVSGAIDSHLRRLRRRYTTQIQRMSAAITDAFPAGTRISQPAGGFVLWVVLPDKIDTEKLFDAAVNQSICFVPGILFSSRSQFTDCMRLSCGHPWGPRIESAIYQLGALACGLTESRRP